MMDLEISDSKLQLQTIFQTQLDAYNACKYPGYKDRIQSLNTLKKLIIAHQDEFVEALHQDFGCRVTAETKLAEILPSIEAIRYIKKRLSRWMRAQRRHVGLLHFPSKNRVFLQPKGVVGIIVPWNYPLFLSLVPVAYAMAAGNTVMVKMSEFTPAFNSLLKKLVSQYFNPTQLVIVEGEVKIAAEFSRLPFHHLLFTGSTSVGRKIMMAAAENLTPVTLELGGKSPVIIDESTNIDEAAKRICFGKTLSAGQTCIAPDYILCPEALKMSLVGALRTAFQKMYPDVGDQNYTRVIHKSHYERLLGYLSDAKNKGAKIYDLSTSEEASLDCPENNKLPLQVVCDVNDDMRVMQDEIFGPILPIVDYDGISEAIAYVNDHPRPLALYYFGSDKKVLECLPRETHSGGMCLNDTVLHVAQDDMPFGGVGASGMGAYHGKEGFETFSHAKAIHSKGFINATQVIYPPHNGFLQKLIFKLFIR